MDDGSVLLQAGAVDVRLRHDGGHYHWFSALVRDHTDDDDVGGLVLNLTDIHRPTGAPAGEASTGQQKALLIGLILASARALSEDGAGPSPLILLDEAAAHLDRDRRAALFDELIELGGQAWLTGTEEFLFEAFEDRAQRVEVEADPDAA